VPYCTEEGEAIGHCGNEPSHVKGDSLLSLRSAHQVGDKIFHEPHLTFVQNGNVIGEMKGRGNKKPAKHYHKAIVELLKTGLIPIGGGGEPEENFHIDDLSEEDFQEAAKYNPHLHVLRGGKQVTEDEWNGFLKHVKPKHEDYGEKINGLYSIVNFHPEFQAKLMDDEDPGIWHALAKNPNLYPEHQKTLAMSESPSVREALAENPNVHKDAQIILAEDRHPDVIRALAKNPNLHKDIQLKLAIHKDPWIRFALTRNPNLHHETLTALVKNPLRRETRDAAKQHHNYVARQHPLQHLVKKEHSNHIHNPHANLVWVEDISTKQQPPDWLDPELPKSMDDEDPRHFTVLATALRYGHAEHKPQERLSENAKKLAPQEHPDVNFTDEDPWVEAKYRNGGHKEYEDFLQNEYHPGLDNESEHFNESVVEKDEFEYDTITGDKPFTATDLFRAYKNSPHHPRSLFLKYAINRIENKSLYDSKDTKAINAHENDWMKLHQAGGAADKNGHITAKDLQTTFNKNRHIVRKLVDHQKKLHRAIQHYSHESIKNVDGEPCVALARAYKTGNIGKEHQLVSYADSTETAEQFGHNIKKRYVPLKNIWYSFDLGHKKAAGDHGPENEFLVSSHKHKETTDEVNQLVPREEYSLKTHKTHPFFLKKHPGVDVNRLLYDKTLNSKVKVALLERSSERGVILLPEHQAALAKDRNPAIRRALASNPNLLPEHQATFAKDTHEYIRWDLASNPNLHPEVQAILANDGKAAVRWHLAGNPNLHPKVQLILAKDSGRHVHHALAENSHLHPEHQLTLAKNNSKWIRMALAKNPNLTKEAKAILESYNETPID
jgi:hypothetical protein